MDGWTRRSFDTMFSQRSFLFAVSSILFLVAFHSPNSCLAYSQLPTGRGSLSRRAPSQLHLFQSLQKQRTPSNTGSSSAVISRAAPKSRIPAEQLSILNKGFGVGSIPPFPYTFDLLPKTTDDVTISNQATKMVVRHLEEEDITRILPEVVREFGSLMSSSQENTDESAKQLENYIFSLTVLIGLTQRVKRRKKGYPVDESPGAKSNYPDHNVVCIVEQIPIVSRDSTESGTYTEQIVGIGEISWQPPNPNRNAPPFVVPFFVKQILARFSSTVDENGQVLDAPRGYISNVLVYKNRRGLGYGRVLMAALEGVAKMWGCADVRLHVDADEKSGEVAQRLYRKLGYCGVPDRGSSSKKPEKDRVGYEWMGPSMANEGLYMVDGIPLLYMQKSLVE